MARKNTMTPSTSENLDRFLAAYKACKHFIVSYGIVKNEVLLPPSSNNQKMIKKFDITVVDAWEVGPNDIEMMAIDRNDNPIIPKGIETPPILETFKRKLVK